MYRSTYSVIALVVLAGLVMLAFRPVSGSSQNARISVGDVAAEVPTVEPLSPFPLLALWRPANWRDGPNTLEPVNPLTLEPLPGYEPIEFDLGEYGGGYIEHAINPDGTSVAVVTHAPSGTMEPGRVTLHIVDLLAWQVTIIDEWEQSFASSNPGRPEFSPDGRTLYWFEREPLVMGEWQLNAYDLDSAIRTAVATLPADIGILEHRANPGGEQIAVLGVPIERGLALPNGGSVSGDYTVGNAQVFLVNVAGGTGKQHIELDGVAAGSFGLTDVEEDDAFPVQNVSPGFAWSDDGRYLYIAHADKPGLTVVDLDRSIVVDQYDLAADDSLLDQLANWLVPTAQATARAFSRGYCVLLSYGDRLAVAMNQERRGLDRTKLESVEHAPVQLVDTSDGEVLWQADGGGVHGIASTPTGDGLLVQTYPRIYPSNLDEFEGQHKLLLLDGETGHTVRELDLPGWPSGGPNSMIAAGEHAYIDTGSEIVVVEPETLDVVGGWQWEDGEPNVYKLIPLP